jgi:hypothetical protein
MAFATDCYGSEPETTTVGTTTVGSEEGKVSQVSIKENDALQFQNSEEENNTTVVDLCSAHRRNKGSSDTKSTKDGSKSSSSSSLSLPICDDASSVPWYTSDQVGNERRVVCGTARVLLVGIGADELMAGYGRHRTAYRNGGCEALRKELDLDFGRLWTRNLGRDDRCISDHGKEARFPFLDEDVISFLRSQPLTDIARLDLPSGVGDKYILRRLAESLGLSAPTRLPKRAIQFGSRIAKQSNVRFFGSNRQANMKAAGSAVFR